MLSQTSRAQTPYLLSGITDAVEMSNSRNERVQQRMHDHEMLMESTGEEDGSKYEAVGNEKEFSTATNGLEKSLRDLHRQMETFDPLNRKGPLGKSTKKRMSDDDDEDEEGENLREKFEAYKMVRKIEPELPPLTPLPPLSTSKRLPDTPVIDFNLSKEAMDRHWTAAKVEASRRQKVQKEKQMSAVAWRREHALDESKQLWEKALRQKKKQAEDALAARRDGGNSVNAKGGQAVDKNYITEKWLGVYAMAAFLQAAREEVAFNRKPPEERLEVIKQRQAAGKEKRTDVFHMQNIKIDEYMQDTDLTSRLDMLARLFQARVRVKNRRHDIHLMEYSLRRWTPKGNMFLCFKRYVGGIRHVQAWWRQKSIDLKHIRDKVAKRWEKLERYGTSGYHQAVPNHSHLDLTEPAKRNLFLDHELRARRFFGLSHMQLWREDSAKWEAQEQERKKSGLRGTKDIQMAPLRPSYLPTNHISTESAQRPCRDNCLGLKGDNEILAMIKACRNNPKGGGWTQIPQKQPAGSKKGSKAKSKKGGNLGKGDEKGDDKADEEDVTAGASLFGVAPDDELQRWGVHPSEMPRVGYKPNPDEGEGQYP